MIIGLFLTVMLLFMWPLILKLFRVQNPEAYSAKYIFIKVWNIVSCVSTWIVSVVTDYPNNNPFGDTIDPFWINQGIWVNNWNSITIYNL